MERGSEDLGSSPGGNMTYSCEYDQGRRQEHRAAWVTVNWVWVRQDPVLAHSRATPGPNQSHHESRQACTAGRSLRACLCSDPRCCQVLPSTWGPDLLLLVPDRQAQRSHGGPSTALPDPGAPPGQDRAALHLLLCQPLPGRPLLGCVYRRERVSAPG